MHITLQFLGDVEELDVVPRSVRAPRAIAESIVPAFSIEVAGLGAFPTLDLGHERLWAGVKAGLRGTPLRVAAVPIEDEAAQHAVSPRETPL